MALHEDSGQHAWFPVAWVSLLRKERVVLAVVASISSFMGRDGRAWPSRSAIAKRAGIKDLAAVTKAIARIRTLGLFEIEERSGRSTIYSRRPSVTRTLGDRNSGSLLPRNLSNPDPPALGKGYLAEREKKSFQESFARKRAGDEKKVTRNGDFQELVMLIRQSDSKFADNPLEGALYVLRKCCGHDYLLQAVTCWLAHAITAGVTNQLDAALDHGLRNDPPPDSAALEAFGSNVSQNGSLGHAV